MLWRFIKSFLLIGIVMVVAVFLSSGSLSNWQEVRNRILEASGKIAAPQNKEEIPPVPTGVSLDTTENNVTKEVLLYFTDAQGKYLYAEKRNIPKVEGIAKETLQALIEGPQDKVGHFPVITNGTKVLGVNVKQDGLCIVDLSNEVSGKTMLYAIVNTLTQFPTIERVKILTNGQEKSTLAGNENMSGEIMRDNNLIK